MLGSTSTGGNELRQVHPKWSKPMIVASIAISFLGAFTSTQLMCHARAAHQFSSVFVWALLGSLIFGFCSVWSLHEVAMLAYEFDLPIGVDAPLTILSALLAVSFTFAAMAGDLLYDRWRSARFRNRHRHIHQSREEHLASNHYSDPAQSSSSIPLLALQDDDEESARSLEPYKLRTLTNRPPFDDYAQSNEDMVAFARQSPRPTTGVGSANSKILKPWQANGVADAENAAGEASRVNIRHSSTLGFGEDFDLPPRSATANSSLGSSVASHADGAYSDGTLPTDNGSMATTKLPYLGLTTRNVVKGFIWSLAISSMHYVGIFALRIPHGYYRFSPGLLILSAVISWLVCTVGVTLMAKMESYLPKQMLYSVIATTGVGAMHFTAMGATTFWSTQPASDRRGFPQALAGTVVGVAFVTCIVANVLLSHSATVSRNKLAEIVRTRRELSKNIALKEHAEAAARSRSEFIASASHEIRTPLHHLQGYSDLLAQTQLTVEGRELLSAIQRATKTLSLLTNNVLDWSKFEGDTNGEYRPTDVDVRSVCESVITLLPNIDDDAIIDIYVVVAPNVPTNLSLDESWIHRVIMNLLSNALKFTKIGYILLSLTIQGNSLVVTVKDTGCGLDPNFIPDMWTPFKQGEVRGSARGTGLGLSIIRQLVQRMNGSIKVQSKYQHTLGVGPTRSGTEFTVNIPVCSTMSRQDSAIDEQRPKIALLSDNTRSTEGLRVAWEVFGCDVFTVRSIAELEEVCWKYVWVTISFLSSVESALPQLLQREDLFILIPYDMHDTLGSPPGLLKARNVVFLQKPLFWHRFSHRILATKQRRPSATPSQLLGFAPEDERIDENTASNSRIVQGRASFRRKYTILLVEDNAINRKLGVKMLQALSYQTLIAKDGEEALSTLMAHSGEIDCVLMDQSMPKMDGVTATRMIRRMEEEGHLRARTPIIAVTAVVNSQAKEEFREAGANDFLAKPLSLERLRDVLEAYLPVE